MLDPFLPEATIGNFNRTANFPVPILFKTDVYSGFTTEQITAITVFHSGGSNS